MMQGNFELSDNILDLKSYVTNMSFARCISRDNFSKAPKKAKIYQLCTLILSGNYNDLEGRKICPLFLCYMEYVLLSCDGYRTLHGS